MWTRAVSQLPSPNIGADPRIGAIEVVGVIADSTVNLVAELLGPPRNEASELVLQLLDLHLRPQREKRKRPGREMPGVAACGAPNKHP